jgi:hypothetical protein
MTGDRQEASGPWDDVGPILENVVAGLSASDRDAVLLRYYEGKSMAQVGLGLGVSEDAAKKRVAKALQRVRAALVRRGVNVPSVVLTPLFFKHLTQPTPRTLVSAATSTAPIAEAAIGISKGASAMMKMAMFKTAAKVTCIAILSIGIGSGAMFACRAASSRQSTDSTRARTPAAPAAKPVAEEVRNQKVREGDKLRIRIPDLNAQGVETSFDKTVDEKGMISLPYVGLVRLAGLTDSESARAIEDKYRQANILQQAEVSVSILGR